MKYKNILITGGAGFIGSSLAVGLKNRYPAAKIIALDNLKRRGSEFIIPRLKRNGIEYIHGDIRVPEDLILNKKIDLLIECSAEPSVLSGFSFNPLYIINTNLSATVNCLELARKNKADLIFLSTSRVYPYQAVNEIKSRESKTRLEWDDLRHILGWSKSGISEGFTTDGAKSLYGATKLSSEHLIREYRDIFGIKTVINRCGVIAGPWQLGKVDQGVFTFWMLAHYFKKNINYIGFGGEGKQVRDLLHIDDLFRLIDLEIKNLDRINGEIFNAGGGYGCSLSLLEATKLCEKISANRINISKVKQARPADLKIYISDNAKVKKLLGWKIQKSCEDILLDIFIWIKENETAIKGFMPGE